MSSFFVKFEYKQTIKKIRITKDQLTWESICDILTKSFFLAEKDKIHLKYKDLENDEITVSSDEDLAEAFNIYFMKNLIKFFVYYSGVFGQDEKLQNTGYSKIERPRSSTDSVQIMKDPVHLRKSSDNTLTNSNQSPLQLSEAFNTSSQFDKKPRVESLKVNSQELQNIFSEVFSTTDVLKKIQERLAGYVAKEENASSDLVEYQIETDYKAITDYMVGTLTALLNKKAEDKSIEEEQKTDHMQNNFTKNRASSFKESKGLLDINLSESIYGPSYRETFSNSFKDKDQNTLSFNSSTECKNLGSTLGVKLILKNEGGKVKLVSVPADYSIIDSVASNMVEQNKKGYESVEQKEEKVEEPVYNVVLSLKKTTSVEKKHHEFSNQILKPNLHDLDEDLPAPYDKKIVQKFEKGDIAESLYEKIE